ncbi:MAG: NUDIX domain-containing protein, partial [Sphingobacteriales bacterium]
DDCLPKNKAGIYNQAIMDFGAVVCKPQNPFCSHCPLKKNCVALDEGTINVLPIKEKKIKKKVRWFYYLVINIDNKIYVRKREEKDVWQNLFEYVAIEIPGEMDATSFIKSEYFKKVCGKIKYEVVNISGWYKQLLSHQTIYGKFITLKIKKPLQTLEGFQLVSQDKFKKLPFPRLINNWHEDGHKVGVLF